MSKLLRCEARPAAAASRSTPATAAAAAAATTTARRRPTPAAVCLRHLPLLLRRLLLCPGRREPLGAAVPEDERGRAWSRAAGKAACEAVAEEDASGGEGGALSSPTRRARQQRLRWEEGEHAPMGGHLRFKCCRSTVLARWGPVPGPRFPGLLVSVLVCGCLVVREPLGLQSRATQKKTPGPDAQN